MDRPSRRSFLRTACLGSAALLLLAACSTGGADPAGRPTPPPDQAPPTPPPTLPPATPVPVALELWHTERGPATRRAIDALIARFQARHPHVTVSQVPQSWPDLEKKLVGGLAAGGLPELSHAIPYFTPALQAAGALVPVDEVVNAVGRDNLFPHLRDTCAWLGGAWWGIAHAWSADLWAYRGDLADRAGLKEPATWAELVDFVRALAEAEPGLAGLQLAGSPGLLINEDLSMFVGQDGGQLWSDDGKPALVSRAMVDSLELYRDLQPFQPNGWLDQGAAEVEANLLRGRVAVVSVSGRLFGAPREGLPRDLLEPDRLRVMPAKPVGPANPERDPAAGSRTLLDGAHWVVFRKSRAPEWAIEMLKFFYARDNYLDYCDSGPLHLLPVDARLAREPAFREQPLRKRWAPVVEAQLAALERRQAWPPLVLKPADAKITTIHQAANSGILADLVREVVERGQPPEQAAGRAQRRLEQLARGPR